MPIKIPNSLPAAKTLASENIFVMTDTRAKTQDIRPLKILLLNLMPTKIATETQLARLLGNTPIQVELELLFPEGQVSAFLEKLTDLSSGTVEGMETGQEYRAFPVETT